MPSTAFRKKTFVSDSESAERSWASLSPPSTSARELGPGLRRNPLDDGNWSNWSTLAVKAERRCLQETSHKLEEWTDAAAIASWDAAFEGLRDFYDLKRVVTEVRLVVFQQIPQPEIF